MQDNVIEEFCNKYGEPDPERLVLRLCRELLAECPTERGPSPLDVLGSVRNIRRRCSGEIPPGAACSALLVPINGGYEVILNAHETKERQWFSFAHEIVHTFFRDINAHVTPSPLEEHLCDVGAAELTMPLNRFKPGVLGQPLGLELIDQLHEEFNVSFGAAGRRTMSFTDQIACLFLASLARTRAQELVNKGEPVLRVVSWTPSSKWPEKRSYKNRSIAHGFLIADSFAKLDRRIGRSPLGIRNDSNEYELETRAYEYQRGAVKRHRQVVALATSLQLPF